MKTNLILLILALAAPFLMMTCPGASQSYFTQVNTMAAAGMLPDVGYVDALRAPEYIRRGLLTPITVPDSVRGDLIPGLLDHFTRNGKVYALPHDYQTAVLLINPDLFKKYGARSPASWDEFVKAAHVVQDGERNAGNTDFTAVGLTAALWNWLPFLFQAEGSLLNPSGAQLTLNSPQALNALNWYVGLVTKEKVARVVAGEWPDLGAYGGDPGVLRLFAQGKVAMIVGGPRMYHMLKNWQGQHPPVEAVELPAGPNGKRATFATVRGYAIMGAPPQRRDAAYKLLDFATGPEGEQFWLGSPETPPDYVPARRSLQEPWLKQHPDTQAFVNSAAYMRTYQPATASSAALADLDRLAADQIGQVLGSKISPQQALNAIQNEGSRILAASQ